MTEKMQGQEEKENRGGAPLGNMNSAKSVLPALQRLKRGKALPANLQRVTLLAEAEAQELIQDKGGKDTVSVAERLLIQAWKSARMAWLLIWNEVLDGRTAILEDVKAGSWDLMPGLQRLGPYLSVQGRVLSRLGLERKAKGINNLQAYVAIKTKEKQREEEARKMAQEKGQDDQAS